MKLWRLRSPMICLQAGKPVKPMVWFSLTSKVQEPGPLVCTGRRWISQFKFKDGIHSIFSLQAPYGLDDTHPPWGRAFWFSSLPIQMLISSWNTITDTSRNKVLQLCGHPLAQSSWHIKLIITKAYKVLAKRSQRILRLLVLYDYILHKTTEYNNSVQFSATFESHQFLCSSHLQLRRTLEYFLKQFGGKDWGSFKNPLTSEVSQFFFCH